MTVERADSYVDNTFEDFLDDLEELLAQPSISATGEGVDECTELVTQLCLAYGFDDAVTVSTDGQPSVIAHAEAVDPNAPTLLIYGHYDVQPVDPEQWTSPPFEPTRRAGPDGRERIYARGAGDNKGQWFAHLCAVKAWSEADDIPVNVILLLEGEEESGSPNLGTVVREYADVLAADLALVADGPIDTSGTPHVLMGARGMLYVQIDTEGPNRDLHSGNYGGPVPNPAWELVRILASMKDENGHVTIDGFYDDVRPITDRDREALDQMPFDAEAVKEDLSVDHFTLGPGESYLEQLLYYPTCNIAGFTSGYGGEGTKTIVPSKAQVKMDMRLVADQDPDDIWEKYREHVHEHASGAVDLEVSRLGTMSPQRTPLDHPAADSVMAAVANAWGAEPILKPTLGGSLPTAVFERELNLPVITVPYANEDENNHSPNENLALDCFRNGIRTTIRLLAEFADGERE
ncbi:M20/M25/M40 family metallo-hydrolase [Halegenticoccus tardaugens]|uniref:M20/M25/M40 family metallo-hydrolase n=1 Tax=Halegenticoccus tardaugens TaxID=2071624 RepID=UPI00100B912E|nr:M20/M25/M40 family metallo-hydrolase [Halegenticoccus tardaugens]